MGLVVKRLGVLSKVQTLDLVLGVGVFSLLPRCSGKLFEPIHIKMMLLEDRFLCNEWSLHLWHRSNVDNDSEGVRPYFLFWSLLSEIPRRGRSRRGRCANLSQIARQICAKLLVVCFVHQRKGGQNCRKFVANLKVNFGQFYANTPFPMPPSPNFCHFFCQTHFAGLNGSGLLDRQDAHDIDQLPYRGPIPLS